MLSLSKHLFNKIASLLTMTALLLSCAQMVPLTGGDKDIDPPKEVESTPKNGTILFSEKSISIEFDEYIKLTNVMSQLIVSPLMENPPEVLVKGKKLIIKLNGELAENTTYSLNFGNSISDITENNVFPNYKYVFSTGTYLDSLSYSGTVINAFDLSKKEGTYVLLYDQFEDSVPLNTLPRYVALTDKEGIFSITNIANGKYKFFAINDINGNYLFDLPNEAIAFKSEIIQLDSSLNDNHVFLFEEKNGLQHVLKAENKTYGKIDIVLNLPTENLTVTALNQYFKTKFYTEEINEIGDSLTIWLNTTEGIENLELELKDGSDVIDTVDISILNRSEFKDTSLLISTNLKGSFDLNKDLIINSARPVIDKIISNIKLFEDSTEVLINYLEVENPARNFNFTYAFKENTNYQLFIPPGTFEDIYGLKNDTIKIDFKTKSESDYGTINLNINPNFSDNYIVQLFKNDKLIRVHYFKDIIIKPYKYLLPGDYELKLIIDPNSDKKWNTGNYLEGLQPEKVIYYEKEIKIRANWDNDIIWTVNE